MKYSIKNRIRFTAIFLCLALIFAMFSGITYAQSDVIYIEETTIVIEDGKVVSGDASLVDKGVIVIGDSDATDNEEASDDTPAASADSTSSGKQPVKDNSALLNPEGNVIGEGSAIPNETPNAVNPNAPTESEKATIDYTVAQASSVYTNHASGANWGASSSEGMVMHNLFTLPNTAGTKTCTVTAAILVRGNCPNDPSQNASYYVNTVYSPMFRVKSEGKLVLHNETTKQSGHAVLEGARFYHTTNGEYNATLKTHWSQAVNWTTGSTVDMAPLLYVDGGTADIYETYFQNAYSKTYSYDSVKGNGGAIRMKSGTLNMYIKGTTGPNKVATDSNCKILDCTAVNGGGIYVDGGTATLNGVEISGCNATDGGAIYVGASGIADLNNVTISDCHATSEGGAIYVAAGGQLKISNTEITNCTATHGGAIYLQDKGSGTHTITLTNVTITLCEATGTGNGGAMWVGTGYTINFNSGEMSENTAEGGIGGAIALARPATFNLKGGTITDNTAKNGGGVGCYTNNDYTGDPDFNMSSGTLSNNTATVSGGGVYVRCGAGHSISGGSVTGNESPLGAGVYLYNNTSYTGTTAAKLTISSNANIYKNGHGTGTLVTTKGGGVYIGSGGTLVMSNGTIGGTVISTHANQATYGGGVYLESGTSFTMNNGKIDYNKATAEGGGIYSNGATVTINGGSISGNTATSYGGGMHILGPSASTVKITGSNAVVNINNNTSDKDGGGIDFSNVSGAITGVVIGGGANAVNIKSNTAKLGGGIRFRSAGNYAMSATIGTNTTISSNTASTATGNYPGGGGVFIGANTTVNMSGGTISGNNANSGAGVIVAGGTCNLSGTAVNSNTATAKGGGFYVYLGTLNMTGGSINSNTAENGGGIYITNTGNVSITKGSVNSNTATYSGTLTRGTGGGIHLEGSGTLSVNGSSAGAVSISSNTAQYRGGGIYTVSFKAETTLDITNATISSNKATYDRGGGVYAHFGTVTDGVTRTINITSCTVQSNVGEVYDAADTSVQGHGGGVYIAKGKINITDTAFTQNKCTVRGAGVYCTDGSVAVITDCTFTGNESKGMNNGAPTGGGGGLAAYMNAHVTVTGGSFNGNTTGISGGAIDVNGTTGAGNATIVLNGVSVGETTANTAPTSGGGIHLGALVDATITDVTVANNTAGYNGGGIFFGDVVDADVTNITVTNNSATNDGGGVCVAGGATVAIDGTNNIQNNKSYHYGGGIIVLSGGVLEISGTSSVYTTISGNKVLAANTGGAGVHVASGASFEMSYGSISSNDAGKDANGNATTSHGGGVDITGGNATLTNVTLTGNIAGSHGAGVCVNQYGEGNPGTLEATGCSIIGNTARSGNGGGVMVTNSSTANLQSCFVTGNYAKGTFTQKTAKCSVDTLVGAGGGIAVFDGGEFSLTGSNIAIYGNTATTAGNDVFANGNSTSLAIPAPSAMNTTGFGKENAVWWEDYLADDTSYADGLYGEPRVIARYADTPISIRAYTTAEGGSPSGRYIDDANRYVAITFDVQKYNVGSIKITAPDATDTNQRFVFTVSGETTLGDVVNFSISLPAGESVTIAQMLPGTYTVTLQGSWSWRYSVSGAQNIVTVTGLEVDELHELEYTANRDKPFWLDHNSPVATNTATLPTVAYTIDMTEAKRNHVI